MYEMMREILSTILSINNHDIQICRHYMFNLKLFNNWETNKTLKHICDISFYVIIDENNFFKQKR